MRLPAVVDSAHHERLLRDDAQRIARKAATLGLNAQEVKVLIDHAFDTADPDTPRPPDQPEDRLPEDKA